VANNASHTNLTADDTANSSGPDVTLTSSSISSAAFGTISYTASQLSSLTLGSQSQVTVNSTGILANGGQTTINGIDPSTGFQNINVLTTAGPLTCERIHAEHRKRRQLAGHSRQISWNPAFLDSLPLTIRRIPSDAPSSKESTSPELLPRPFMEPATYEAFCIWPDRATIISSSAMARADIGTEVDGGGGNDSLTVGLGHFNA